jgi:hypothetical protein
MRAATSVLIGASALLSTLVPVVRAHGQTIRVTTPQGSNESPNVSHTPSLRPLYSLTDSINQSDLLRWRREEQEDRDSHDVPGEWQGLRGPERLLQPFVRTFPKPALSNWVTHHFHLLLG